MTTTFAPPSVAMLSPATRAPAARLVVSRRSESIAFGFLLAACAVLFIRPTEIIPALADWPIYEVLVACCCVISLPILLGEAFSHWRDRPLNVCVLGLLAAVVMSHLSHLFIWGARHSAMIFGKLAIVYLLVVGLTNTAARFRTMMALLTAYTVILTSLALLQHHHVINLPGFDEYPIVQPQIDSAEESAPAERLSSVGIFNDPNDLCLILLFGLMASLFWLRESRRPIVRAINLLAVAMFLWALQLTQSRGGFLALSTSVATLFISRFGWKRAIVPLIVVAPLAVFIYSGRQTEISATEGTGLARVQLWSEALTRFRHAPFFGIGMDQFVEEVGWVVHNSFLQCFVELGFFGGMMFLGAFIASAAALRRLGQFTAPGIDPMLVRMRPYLLATLAAYAVGYTSLSRCYTMPMYLVLGIIASYLRLATPRGLNMPQFGMSMLARFAGASVLFIGISYLFVRTFARWGTH